MGILPSGDPTTWTLDHLSALINNVTRAALAVAMAVALLYIIIGAYGYLTAFGSEEKATNGKKTITWALVGFVVIILAEVIVSQIWSRVTNDPLLNPSNNSSSPPAPTLPTVPNPGSNPDVDLPPPTEPPLLPPTKPINTL